MRLPIIAALALCLGGASWAADLPIVRDGHPTARICVAANASQQLTAAAATLVNCVQQASGATLPVVKDNALKPFEGVNILIGVTSLDPEPPAFPKDFDGDGFFIVAQGKNITICGPTDWGTQFGVYDFLEKYVGVRWLMPGPDGVDIPPAKTITIPAGTVSDQPVFMSRLLSGLRGPMQTEWALHNRMHGRIKFHHNLLHLFPPDTYTKTHPEFFPIHNGKRYLPPNNHISGWQPCFSAPGLVDEAIKNIDKYFDEHPEETSYSLGVNDGSGFCQCPKCLAAVGGRKNFLGRADYSDLYYSWCNKVIAGVLKTHPDKWFGCLAYSEVAGPPSFKLNPRLIPYMTYDRMKWIDPKVEAAGHKATEEWQKAATTLGWYDYIYGTPYCLPRVYFHETAKYLRYAEAHGVKALYAEIYPNWGEGPKPYIYLKLWWNPNQNVDALLKEWYDRCAGPAAAPYLAQYYAIWENFWTKDILKSKWFTENGQYLNFGSPTYLADVKPEYISESRRLLETCLSKCKTDKQRARVQLLEKAFEYYEASVIAYQANQALGRAKVDTEADALATLNSSVQALEMAQKRRYLALDVFPKNPVLVNPLGLDRFPALAGKNWGGNGIWAVADWVMKGDNPVRQKVEDLAANCPSQLVRDQARMMLDVIQGKAQTINANPSFEEGKGKVATGWEYWVKPQGGKPVGAMLRSEDVAHTGKASLLCDGMWRGAPTQTIKFPGPGRYCFLGWVYTPPGQVSKGTVELAITPRDDRGANLPSYSTQIVPRAGQWTLMVVGADIPAEINGKKVTSLLLVPIVNGFQDGGKVYWDDVSLQRLRR